MQQAFGTSSARMGISGPLPRSCSWSRGVDGYGEIDVDAGMDPVEVKRRFPKLTLWGGVSCGKVLAGASPEGVRAEVRRVLEQCKPGGGLIFGSSNSIHAGIPTENFLAMQEAAREFGRYAM